MKSKLFLCALIGAMTIGMTPMTLKAEEINVDDISDFVLPEDTSEDFLSEDVNNHPENVTNQNTDQSQMSTDTNENGGTNWANDETVIQRQELVINLTDNGIYLNGMKLTSEKPFIIKDSAIYLPLRTIVKDIYGGTLSLENGVCSAEIPNLSLMVTIGSKDAFRNGEPVFMEMPLIMENGTVYCPVKAMAALFDAEIEFKNEEKKLVVDIPTAFIPPVPTVFAEFSFGAESYVQGQYVIVNDTSYDVNGKMIVGWQWMLDGNDKNTKTDINELLKKPSVGVHTVSLKVKNQDGKWSDWVSKEITFEQNQNPVVTSIKQKKTEYAQGELLDFDYTYENEDWEAITDAKWSYKQVGEADTNKITTMPEYIFCEGDYEVTLQLKDDFGNWSEAYTSIVHITDEVKNTELNYRFSNPQTGTVINNYQKRNYRDFEEIIVSVADYVNGTHILSDSPELVTENGILYMDYINGAGRVNFNHFNQYPENPLNKKIVIMAENVTDKPVTVRLSNKVIKGPSNDELYLGQMLLYDFLRQAGDNNNYTLAPGQKVFIVDTENKKWDSKCGLVGQFDIETSGKVKLTFAAVNKGTTTSSMGNLPNLAKSVHPRGTFPVTELHYNITAPSGKETYFLLGKDRDEWSLGTDAVTGEYAMNYGNYGIIYKINITAEEDTGIILNPRGGGFRGAVRINGGETYLVPKNAYFGTDGSKSAVLTTVRKGETVLIEYTLPNGSASPILFGMIPSSFWMQTNQ